ncbi:hypothetical protein Ccar_16555 [Clostridium carboxidivorans P7]|uniref:P2 family phage major capsid protein n=1 Tax=Clostridium carboxidivorans TaxID=217159 RepID=UPI00064F810D|nr:P2 family phage major capsid protein [Clostridium carboxidivorans]AKN32384.1 hypothetical protein Ccar_16555 [Clostridium carboxidivorans P7]
MSISNGTIIEKAAVTTSGKTNGMLNPEQSKAFLNMIFDDSSFLGELSHQTRTVTKGTIDKLGIGRRLLRAQVEATDTLSGKGVEPVLGSVPYSCTDVVLGAEISEKFLRENIEQEGFETKFMGMIASQVKVDMLDLAFNGDTAVATADPDHDFLVIDDGIVKQLATGSHILDATTIGTAFTDSIFTGALRALPSKYFNKDKFRWIANNDMYIRWIEYLKKRNTAAGDMAILNGTNINPLNVEWRIVPNFPDNKIILGDPSNFTVVNTYDISLRKTTEGKEAVFRDMRFYALHLNMDTIILEKDAVVTIDKIPAIGA